MSAYNAMDVCAPQVKADKAKLDAELAEVRDELFKRWHLIRSFFMYYSMAGGASGACALSTRGDALTTVAAGSGILTY